MNIEEFKEAFAPYEGKKRVYINTNGSSYLFKKSDEMFYQNSYVNNMSSGDVISYSNIVNLSVHSPIQMDTHRMTLGSDPEIFFIKDDKVLPSSSVVPEGGVNKVIRDGFQGELNPSSDGCRQTSGSYIYIALMDAKQLADNVGATLSFKVGHIISEDVWKKTPSDVRRFGCSPTLNVHEKNFKRVTGVREKFRAGGGHIHLGGGTIRGVKNTKRLVSLMDIFAGNTCVLIDRDPDNARRRKNYGRAGEYRVKSYGLEYRVLSNFWLKGYALWSLVTILLRNALAVEKSGRADEFLSLFDMKKVRKAINNNDFELAKENFEILSKFLKDNKATGNGLNAVRVDKFYRWATSSNPLGQWDTTEKVLKDWEDKNHRSGTGFEQFIENK